MIKIGMMIGDRYEILEKIGTGGMSDVYKAKCHKLNRFVAVKVLKQEFSENANFVSKFRIEAQAAAGLMHPNIVNVYDVGNENGINYIVMELVEGITVKEPERPDECCGFGGMFSMEEREVSIRMGKDKLQRHIDTGAEYITGPDSSCLMHMQGIARSGKYPIRFIHIVEILASGL